MANNLLYAYSETKHTYASPPNLTDLNGGGFIEDADSLYEIQGQFNFYIVAAVREAFLAANEGVLEERQFQKLTAYYGLAKKLNENIARQIYKEKNVADYEKDFTEFYLSNEEEISALIN